MTNFEKSEIFPWYRWALDLDFDVTRKLHLHFFTSGGAANLGDAFGDLFEHHGSGIAFFGNSESHIFIIIQYTLFEWTRRAKYPLFALWRNSFVACLKFPD